MSARLFHYRLESLSVTGIRLDELLSLTSEIVAAHLSNHEIDAEDLPALISNVHGALESLRNPPRAEPAVQKPAVPIGSSVKVDHIVCLEDGKKLKMLKRHLFARYGMAPAEYRAKWNLPVDYPMVAPGYAASRSEIAKRSGLGRTKENAPLPASPTAPATLIADDPAPPVEVVEAPVTPARRKLLKPVFGNAPTSAEAPRESDGGAVRTGDAAPLAILRNAIARQSCVTAMYNKRSVTLAPHIIYTRHDEPYLRAVTVSLDGKKPRELKLGTFKVAGLGAVGNSGSLFVRHPDFSADDADYVGAIVAAIASAPPSSVQARVSRRTG